MSVGTALREAREKAGLSRKELAHRLCMTTDKLGSLEEDAFEQLAEAIYVRGYIRNACKELGLDATPFLAAFSRQMPAETASQAATASRGPVMAGQSAQRGALFIPSVLVAVVVAAGGYWWFSQPGSADSLSSADIEVAASEAEPVSTEAISADEFTAEELGGVSEIVKTAVAESEVAELEVAPGTNKAEQGLREQPVVELPQPEFGPEIKLAERQAAVPAITVPATGAPDADVTTEVIAASVSGPALSLTFSKESWVEVTDATGNKLLARLQAAGSHVEVKGEAPFNLMLGNAAGTTVSYAGEKIDSEPRGNRRTRRLTVGG